MIRVLHVVGFPIVLFCFRVVIGRGLLQVMINDHFFSIFGYFGLFLQVFGQVIELSILEFHEMIRVPHLVACPIVLIFFFFFFFDQEWGGGVLKLIKNDDFVVLLAVWVLFPKFWGRLRSCLC